MTTATEQHSPETARKSKAEAALQQLRTEREQILTRQQTAQATIERLNHDITRATRSGEADTLAALRSDRREAEESVQDLARALPTVNRDIELAEGELIMAERAVQAEQYNKIQGKQAALLKMIVESVDVIVSAIGEKQKLAVRQERILADVRPGSNLSPDTIRRDLAHAITARLQGNPPTALRTIDWSVWQMSSQSDLLR